MVADKDLKLHSNDEVAYHLRFQPIVKLSKEKKYIG